MVSIGKILSGQALDAVSDPEVELPPNVLAQMKFSPITSCDVERSFSDYKSILTDSTSFTPENLEMHVICYYESRNQQK